MITINEIKNHPNVLVEPPNRHGSFHLVCSLDTLMVIPIGTWSEGCAQRYIRTTKRLLTEHGVSRFGGLVCLDRWELATPNVLKMLNQFHDFSVQSGMVCEALLGSRETDVNVTIVDREVVNKRDGERVCSDIQAALQLFDEYELAYDQTLLESVYQHRFEF